MGKFASSHLDESIENACFVPFQPDVTSRDVYE